MANSSSRKEYKVSLVVPDHIADYQIKEYIEEALSEWSRSFDPGDYDRDPHPLFDFSDWAQVRVLRIKKSKSKSNIIDFGDSSA